MKALIFVIAGTGTPRVSPPDSGPLSTPGRGRRRRAEPVGGRRNVTVENSTRAAKGLRIDAVGAAADS
ncbi:MAG: hypothetical protein IT201_08435 [Thermoleophilia bacterium]|nr:hypothetical protein [Thermoleophilia bacterium]